MRRICYVSGTRADFGLMSRALEAARTREGLGISVCVTGMHLSPTYGYTVEEIEAAGFRICARIHVDVDSCSGLSMASALGRQLAEFARVLATESPDCVLVLGDRGEMLAAALAAIHMNIPVVHIHGGERSGTVDEPIRHAISKLSHYHFVATAGARERLIRMGERPDNIFVTGAPGLDGLTAGSWRTRTDLCADADLDTARPIALVILHPVVQDAADAGTQAREVLEATLGEHLQALCLAPNSDAGGLQIRQTLSEYGGRPDVRVLTHLRRHDFASWMASADIMVGNSSSGIIEAASFNLPVVNVGNRQHLRERNSNTIDVAEIDGPKIRDAIRRALAGAGTQTTNIYGDGAASDRIAALLAHLPLTSDLLSKSNAY